MTLQTTPLPQAPCPSSAPRRRAGRTAVAAARLAAVLLLWLAPVVAAQAALWEVTRARISSSFFDQRSEGPLTAACAGYTVEAATRHDAVVLARACLPQVFESEYSEIPYTRRVRAHRQRCTKTADEDPGSTNRLYWCRLLHADGRLESGTVAWAGANVSRIEERYVLEVPDDPQPPRACEREVGNPVDVASGAKYQRERDVAGGLPFTRHYSSTARGGTLGEAWRHDYQYALTELGPRPVRNQAVAVMSASYATPSAACQQGWRDVRAQLAAPWAATASAVYDAGSCRVVHDGTVMQQVSISTATASPPSVEVVELTRPDGAVLRFAGSAGAWHPLGGGQGRLERRDDGWRFTGEDDRVERYDPQGRLQTITARGGATRTFAHDGEGRVTGVRDAVGRRLAFQYGAAGRLAAVSGPDGSVAYGYDSAGNLSTVTYPDDTDRHYHYDDPSFPHALTGLTDAAGHRYATWAYDAQGRAISSEHAGGAERTALAYHADGSTTVTNALGRETTYHFETLHGVRRVTRVEGHPTPSCAGASRARTYTPEGWLASTTDWQGNRTTYAYNARGLETARVEAAGTVEARTITTDWHPERRLPVRVTEAGRVTESTYDAHGRVLRRTITDTTTGAARTWSSTYHPEATNADGLSIPGPLATVDGPREDVVDVTRYAYDAQHNLTQVTNALGHATRITEHDAAGRPLAIVDPNGITTQLTYDARGRLLTRTTDGATTHFTYDPNGNLTTLTLPTGTTLTYHVDAARRLVGLADALGNRITYRLDAAGNRIEEHRFDASGQLAYTHTQVFDELSRLRAAIGAAGQASRTTYDANGNPTETIDANGHPTAAAFDALNRLVETVDADGGRTTYGYNAADRLTEVADPRGNATRYTYNGFGERIRRASPDTGESTFAVDAAGNRIRATDARGQVTEWTYDALNRLTAVRYPDDPARDVALHYDAPEATHGLGRLTAVEDASGTTRYHYTPRGLLQEETHETADGVSHSVRYAYDAADQFRRLTYPGGAVVHYARDAAGQVSRVTLEQGGVQQVLADHLGYAPFGPLTAFTYGNGLAFSESLDQDYRLEALTSGPVGRDYAQDPAGNITTITDHNDHTRSQTFGYDQLHRLTDAQGGYGQRGYDYDVLGNRETKHDNGRHTDYTIDTTSNRLRAIDAEDLEFDAAGNLVRQGARTFAYDGAGRLNEVRRDGSLIATYTYNARGQRTRKQVRLHGPGQGQAPADRGRPAHAGPPAQAGHWVSTHFIYDQAGRLLAELDGRGTVQRAYVWLAGEPLALLTHTGRGLRLAYYHIDHLGTPQALTDARGNVVWAAAYRPFGAAAVETETVTNNLRFPGQYYDAETGLHYNGHRYYDPESGRYLTSDPIGLAGGLHTYSYARNNPVFFSDPLGLDPPEYHPGVDVIRENVIRAENIANPFEFRDLVRNSGPWDYKQNDSMLQDFGNYNYGMAGAASGLFDLDTLLREAGRAQCEAGTSDPRFGTPASGAPYGDDPIDQFWIREGWDDYHSGMHGEPRDSRPIWQRSTSAYSRRYAPDECSNACGIW